MQKSHQNITFLNIAVNWKANPRIAVASVEQLRTLLAPLSGQEPGFIELDAASGLLQLGVGGPFACAQFTTRDNEPRYLSARPRTVRAAGDIEFLCGGTPTPIPRELCLSFKEAVEIAEYFFETGARNPEFQWAEV